MLGYGLPPRQDVFADIAPEVQQSIRVVISTGDQAFLRVVKEALEIAKHDLPQMACLKPHQKAKRRGRPKGSLATDRKHDREVYEAWKNSGFRTYEEFARESGGMKADEVKAAIDRHRHRLKGRKR